MSIWKGLHIDIRNNNLQEQGLIIIECYFVFLFVSLGLLCKFWTSLDKLSIGLASCKSSLPLNTSNLFTNSVEHLIVRKYHPEFLLSWVIFVAALLNSTEYQIRSVARSLVYENLI